MYVYTETEGIDTPDLSRGPSQPKPTHPAKYATLRSAIRKMTRVQITYATGEEKRSAKQKNNAVWISMRSRPWLQHHLLPPAKIFLVAFLEILVEQVLLQQTKLAAKRQLQIVLGYSAA
ncbi:hypothetical protein PMIN01_04497 [Paraphaeosphaeria minitans]|uniref:Uncharacterized protein n=1 Tax=Paraphaeosphaeria minitans TaxID=565426 RepID=A0A9P6KRC9_9PLEO|nr:hypothetical protein PMIN01_04497 [Paraphaeosphaeria minitans]